MVYSDRPPPPDVKPADLVKQPPKTLPAPQALGASGAIAPAPASAATKTAAELDMEFRQRQQARDEAERKSAEQRAAAQARAADCELARGYLAGIERGERVVRVNAQGEREYLDDAQRDSELARVRQRIAAACK